MTFIDIKSLCQGIIPTKLGENNMITKIFRFKRIPANDNSVDGNQRTLVGKTLKDVDYKNYKIAIIMNAIKFNHAVVLPFPDCVEALGEELAWDLALDLKRKKLICRDDDGVLRVNLYLAFSCAGKSDKETVKWLRKWV